LKSKCFTENCRNKRYICISPRG